jgi:hypothetical protein
MQKPNENRATGPASERPVNEGLAGARKPETLLEQMDGVPGMIYAAIPILLFVIVNALTSLVTALGSALAAAAAITLVRLVRRERLQPAVSGFIGVAICALIAWWVGEARGFFLFGIWASAVYGTAFLLSVVLRWPLVGVIWSLLNGDHMRWRRDRVVMRAYDIATLAFAAVFAARFFVQNRLYLDHETGWLAIARIGMGFPLFALAVLVAVWAVRRANARAAD